MAHRAAAKPLALYAAVFGALTTYIGAYDRFGLAGASLLVALLFALVWGLFQTLEWSQSARAVLLTIRQLADRPTSFLFIAAFFVFLSVVVWAFGGAFRFSRSHLPLEVPNLRVASTTFLDHRFPSTSGARLGRGRDLNRQEQASAVLLRWASQHARKDLKKQLYYIESVPIPKDCDSVPVSCVFMPPMTVRQVAAYLVSPSDDRSLWVRPVMRQQPATINANGARVAIQLTRPNADDRLVLFVLAQSHTSSERAEDAPPVAEPDNLLKHHYFEFD